MIVRWNRGRSCGVDVGQRQNSRVPSSLDKIWSNFAAHSGASREHVVERARDDGSQPLGRNAPGPFAGHAAPEATRELDYGSRSEQPAARLREIQKIDERLLRRRELDARLRKRLEAIEGGWFYVMYTVGSEPRLDPAAARDPDEEDHRGDLLDHSVLFER